MKPVVTPIGNMHDLVAGGMCSTPHGQACRNCGCTDDAACIVDVAGELVDVADGATLPLGCSVCYWVEPDLCSACVSNPPPPLLYGADGQPLRGAP